MSRAVALLLLPLASAAQDPGPTPTADGPHGLVYDVEIDAAGSARRDAPLSLVLQGRAVEQLVALGHDLRASLAQKEIPVDLEVVDWGPGERWLVARWVEPRLEPIAEGEAPLVRVLTVERGRPGGASPRFRFADAGPNGRDLLLGGDVVWRQVFAFDPERFEQTYKPYHHLYAPAGGPLLTKGPGGLYGHHRGLFLGWSKTRHAGREHNFWYPGQEAGPYQCRVERLGETAGQRFAGAADRTRWFDAGGTPLVDDVRSLGAWNLRPGEHLIDVAITLRSLGDEVLLDGDPAHGGFQLRVAQEVAERKDCTYVLPASARAHDNDVWSDAAWVVALFTVEGEACTVLFMNHPSNPPTTVWNTRDYGRFGVFFQHTLAPREPLELRYRLWLSAGHHADPLPHAERQRDFATPPRVTATRRGGR